MDRRYGSCRRCTLLREVDARRGRAAHRSPLSEGQGHCRDGARTGRLKGRGRQRAYRHRVAMGADCEMPKSRVRAEMPLVRSFALSTKKGREAWVEPIVDRRAKTISFRAHRNKTNAPSGTKLKGKSRCLICGIDNVTDSILREQASTYSISQQLLAIVAKGSNGRVYLEPPQTDSGTLIKALETPWLAQNLPDNARWFSPPGYGLRTYRDLFTPRQLVTLTTFSDLVAASRERVLEDARKAGMADDGKGIDEGGIGVPAYADAVATYLAFAVDKGADYWSTICSWHSSRELVRNTFARQAIPMVWDFAEANPLSD